MEIIYLVLRVFLMPLWAVVGFFFWLPLINRAVVTFSFLAVSANICGQAGDFARAQAFLETAMGFYARGFYNILLLTEPNGNGLHCVVLVGNSDDGQAGIWGPLFRDMAFSVMWWGSVGFLLGYFEIAALGSLAWPVLVTVGNIIKGLLGLVAGLLFLVALIFIVGSDNN